MATRRRLQHLKKQKKSRRQRGGGFWSSLFGKRSEQPLPGQPLPGQPLPGQPLPGQPLPGQPLPGQPLPGQPLPGQPPRRKWWPFGSPSSTPSNPTADIAEQIKRGDSSLYAAIQSISAQIDNALKNGGGSVEVSHDVMDPLKRVSNTIISWKNTTPEEQKLIIQKYREQAYWEARQKTLDVPKDSSSLTGKYMGRGAQFRVANLGLTSRNKNSNQLINKNFTTEQPTFKRTNAVAVREEEIFDKLMAAIHDYEPPNFPESGSVQEPVQVGGYNNTNPFGVHIQNGDLYSIFTTYNDRHTGYKLTLSGKALRAFAMVWGVFLIALKVALVGSQIFGLAFYTFTVIVICAFSGGGCFMFSDLFKPFEWPFVSETRKSFISIQQGLSFIFPTQFANHSQPASVLYVDYELNEIIPDIKNLLEINSTLTLPGFTRSGNSFTFETGETFYVGNIDSIYLSLRWAKANRALFEKMRQQLQNLKTQANQQLQYQTSPYQDSRFPTSKLPARFSFRR